MAAAGYEELTGGSEYVGTAAITKDHIANNTKEKNVELISWLRKFWAGFHNAILLALLFSLVGIGVGVKVSQQYYGQKLDEVVQTGAMLHKQKVYTIQPKI